MLNFEIANTLLFPSYDCVPVHLFDILKLEITTAQNRSIFLVLRDSKKGCMFHITIETVLDAQSETVCNNYELIKKTFFTILVRKKWWVYFALQSYTAH